MAKNSNQKDLLSLTSSLIEQEIFGERNVFENFDKNVEKLLNILYKNFNKAIESRYLKFQY